MRKPLSFLRSPVDRRAALRWLGIGLGAAPVAKVLAACSDDAKPATGTDSDVASGDTDITTSAETDAATGDVAIPTGWATGGTAAMTAKAGYPDPFAALGSACTLYCSATLGPCHTSSPEREDVSDGWDGLPLRLALRVVDESCNPIEGAIVEIWHTNNTGTYSGNINAICNETAAERAARFFRGYQTTDADGRVAFDSCFPGWYSGRAIHIHFRVMTGAYDGSDSAKASLVSQLFFSDALVESLFAEAALYKDYGTPDTLLGDDSIIGGESDPSAYVCDVRKTSDGAMLASKTLILRSTSAASCSIGA
ncbi:MAG: intradiol ring-cleavage dioxygenase [Myxococcota bacterium]